MLVSHSGSGRRAEQPVVARDAVRGHLRTQRARAEQRRRQLDGTTHAAHFNSAFQSDFRLVNIALTSQLDGRAAAVARIRLHLPVRFGHRHVRALDEQLRSDPVGSRRDDRHGRLAFGFSYQFFSFDHLDGVSLSAVPAVFRHDSFELGGGRADVVSTENTIQANVSQFTGALTYGLTDRVDLSLAVPIVRTQLSLLSNAQDPPARHRHQPAGALLPGPTALGGFGSTHQFFTEGSASGVGDLVLRVKAMMMREGSRALAAGLDARLPTGDEQNLLGAGAMGLRPFAAFSGA